jgi:hypothetical protein
MKFNEDSRVKIPSILHLTRLGYEYISLKNTKWDSDTDIFTDIFNKSIKQINSDKNLKDDDISRIYEDLKLTLENDDLLKKFHEFIKSSIDRILISAKENKELSNLRDCLLPMLMNGQVRVK